MGVQPDQIRECLRARPFQPLVIHLADGRRLPVPHPEFAMMTPSGRTLFVTDENDRVDRVDTLLVTSVSDPEPGDESEG